MDFMVVSQSQITGYVRDLQAPYHRFEKKHGRKKAPSVSTTIDRRQALFWLGMFVAILDVVFRASWSR